MCTSDRTDAELTTTGLSASERRTSTLIVAPLVRLIVEPTAINGLRKRSQLMVDKLFTIPIGDIGSSIGRLETTVMTELNLALRDWLALH